MTSFRFVWLCLKQIPFFILVFVDTLSYTSRACYVYIYRHKAKGYGTTDTSASSRRSIRVQHVSHAEYGYQLISPTRLPRKS